MTATLQRPPGPAPADGPETGRATPPRAPERSAVRRTLLALLAAGLGVTPLRAVLTDSRWLFEGWLTMIVVITPAVLLRLRRPPGALDIWPGIVLLVPLLTRLFVAKHAYGGWIPSGATFTDVSHLMDSLHKTTHDEVAPIHSTVAVRLVVCALIGLLAALVDLIAVVGHRGALAGVPLLVVYTVSGAVPRNPVAWGWFVLAAIGYLVLLQLDAADQLRAWGRQISRTGGDRGRLVGAFSAQRIGVVAVAVAVVIPFLVPDHSRNFISDAFHHSGGNGSGGGFGAGNGNGGSISPFVSLKNQLDRGKPVPLMTVHVEGAPPDTPPFDARVNVLNKVSDKGWTVSDHGRSEPLGATGFDSDPPAFSPRVEQYQVDVQISGATGNPPVFSQPLDVTGLPEDAMWNPRDLLLLGTNISRNARYRETVAQSEPTVAQLRAAPAADRAQFASYLTLPGEPKSVSDMVATITRRAATPYDRARALSDFFAKPDNGFIYSLHTKTGDSGSDLADFLKNRVGFCQQYAAALGIMLRMAGIPSRVVLGYMHPAADSEGNFTITTSDAHAWDEAYFPGVGWVPFDPTPTAGLAGGRSSDLPWAPHVFPSGEIEGQRPSQGRTSAAPHPTESTSGPAAAITGASPGGSDAGLLWTLLVVLAVVAIALIPGGLRAERRRRRLRAARRGDPNPLWAELCDTAVDLGYTWSPARSPRQVSAWLARDAPGSAPSLDALAAAVEQRRYAPAASPRGFRAADLARALTEITGQLRSRRSLRVRVQSRLLPASLGWTRLVRLFPAARRS